MQISFDPDLPISARTDDIAEAIANHQVVVVAGETGSGKTTQLPKVCLQLGLKSIAHTQPRRIAARSVAERIAEELQVDLGTEVGYQVRFTRQARSDTPLVLMTDGVLLAAIAHDRDLRRYDCIIIDEAHERSLNIDFLLGYLKQLLPRRPDLKVIITSATIDTARFSEHFDDAPIIEVSGRTFPVELRYRPLQPDDPDSGVEARDQVDGITAAVTELTAAGPGDILVFLSGEREIRDTAEALTALQLRDTEVLPLYARLSAAEQHRVFTPHTGRRIVLATNVAETSLTVPGIRYVVDPGAARISRWSARTKVQRLPIEPISQASANQRSGRCGRVAAGICIRLYSEDDFEARPEFTEPEILRTNLASVILQMAQAELGEIADFPFVEPPDSAQVADGVRVLHELGALVQQKSQQPRGSGPRLTRIGHQLARIPLDPRLARMLVEAARRDCLTEVIVIAAGLTINDPRERPAEHQQAASELHRRFWAAPPAEGAEPLPDGSDFIAWLRLWKYLEQQRESLSGNAFRRMCRDEFLHFLRIREWQDLVGQLRQIGRELKLERNATPADSDSIHIAILSGVLSQIGLADLKSEQKAHPGRGKRRGSGPRDYLGPRGIRFAINPGSALSRTQPELVMAAELTETTRLWARTVAGIHSEWVEQVGAHLLTRSYSEPHWSARQARVVANERVSLLGVPIIAGRSVGYASVDPAAAREIFIRSALVEGDWRTRHHFFARNAATRTEAEELEERTRRRDLLVDDQAVFDFYDARIPADIVSGAHFDAWWKKKRHTDDGFLDLTLDDLVAGAGPDLSGFPDIWPSGEFELPVRYVFEPGHADDGVQVGIDLSRLNRVRPEPFGWQVPGLRAELATALIRGLPKQIRTRFVPAPEFARRALAELGSEIDDRGFPEALGEALQRLTGEPVPAQAWNIDAVDPHLQITFVVTDRSRGDRELGRGRDLSALQQKLAPQLSAKLTRAATRPGSRGATDWSFGPLADEQRIGGGVGYPGLVDTGRAVDLVLHDSRLARDATHPAGLRRLVQLNTPDPTKWVLAHLSNTDKLALGNSPYATVPELFADARLAAVGRLIDRLGGADTRDATAFADLGEQVRQELADAMRQVVAETAEVLRRTHAARLALSTIDDAEVRADAAEHLKGLIHPGFLSATPMPWAAELGRYVSAIGVRLAARQRNPRRDDELLATLWPLEGEYADLCARQPAGPLPEALVAVGWQLEELRVGLFAQQLGTRGPISAKRIRKALESYAG